ncbi:MAG: fumarylacetoacetate hydrolase family protein [Alicyclobacillus sp.]|nr:fumarylacetoacetate hydrolase family protein [Alicyclobacillus sp.]
MRLMTLRESAGETLAVRWQDLVIPIPELNARLGTDFAPHLSGLLEQNGLAELQQVVSEWHSMTPAWLPQAGQPLTSCRFGPLLRHPRKIWGIGLNYREHAGDLHEVAPTEEPASFMKADTTLIGPGDDILLPVQSQRVTAEAELGVVIGRACKDVPLEEAASVVAGFVALLDMTAEDILQRNPRFLTRAKNFDTFLSLGPELVTTDEVVDVLALTVGTYVNGRLQRANQVAHMTFQPWFLVSFHSQVMTWLPGDLLATGTPGAAVIRPGDVAECRIDGFLPLCNPVREYAARDCR